MTLNDALLAILKGIATAIAARSIKFVTAHVQKRIERRKANAAAKHT